MRRKGAVYRGPYSHKLCQSRKRKGLKRKRVLKRKSELKGCMAWLGVILLCAFFCCAGIQMVEKDAGVLQMESFSAADGQFLALEGEEKIDRQLAELSETSGVPFEKLLAAVMLKNRFRPDRTIREAEVLADVLGYERLDEERFSLISSYYKRMYECVEYLPVSDVMVSQIGKKDTCMFEAKAHVKQAETADSGETADFRLIVPVEEEWKGIVPAVCMKTGTVISSDSSENTLCLELEEGISMVYGNVKQDLREWKPGDVIEGGGMMGSVEGAGLLLQFRLLSEDGSWFVFNGYSCLNHGEKKVRTVTRMLQ